MNFGTVILSSNYTITSLECDPTEHYPRDHLRFSSDCVPLGEVNEYHLTLFPTLLRNFSIFPTDSGVMDRKMTLYAFVLSLPELN